VTRPSTNEAGLYPPGLRFGDPRVVAVLATLVGFCHLLEVTRVTGMRTEPYTCRQATYDLRRLKRKGLIHKIQGTRTVINSLALGVVWLCSLPKPRATCPRRA
jgi:hypothetical protein